MYSAKNQEEQFATILMELSQQYANLTEANTFLLIETETSRRFAGKQHLKELYKRGELKPCRKDFKVTIDPDMSQMVEVSYDDEAYKNAASDLESATRRHIGELPSERKERLKKERSTYNKFVSMTRVDASFATYLMEALMKYSCLTDAGVFFLIETPRARRFTGKPHLCEQYIEGSLRATVDDVEMDFDPTIKVISVERHAPAKEETGDEEPQKEEEANHSAERNSMETEESEPAREKEATMEENEGAKDVDQENGERKRKHVGMLPSELRELKRQKHEAKMKGSQPASTVSSEADADRKHKGELPSERKERIRREREGQVYSGPGFIFGPSTFPSSYDDAAPVGGGTQGWGEPATGFGSYDGGFGDGGYDGGYAHAYSSSHDTGQSSYGKGLSSGYGKGASSSYGKVASSSYGIDHSSSYEDGTSSKYKSSYGNWKSGGTMYGGESSSAVKSSKSYYGW